MRHFFAFLNRRFFRASVLAACLGAAGFAQAEDYSEINRLLRAGQFEQAQTQVAQLLAAKPGDAQIRFFQGVIQSEQGKTAEAIATFNKLTRDFPELPEPYNNLAVLYAGQSQFEQARTALETAIRLNPNYATAHENLGDVYAKLAGLAYGKALQLDAANVGVPPKLALIKNIFAPSSKTVRPAAAKVALPTAAASTAPVVPTAAPVAASAMPPVVPTLAPTLLPTAQNPAAEPNKPEASNKAQAQAEETVEVAVRAWAQAWADKDTKSYFAAYGRSFRPADGVSRSSWEAERKARMGRAKPGRAVLRDLRVTVNGNKATARFYQDGSGQTRGRARVATSLALAKEGQRWVIVRELAGQDGAALRP